MLTGAIAAEGPEDVVKASVPRLGDGLLQFAIPASLSPKVADDYFTLSTDFPGFHEPDNSGTRVRSVFVIVRTRPEFGTLALNILNGQKANLKEIPAQAGCRAFTETVPGKNTSLIYFLFDDEHGNPVVVTNPGGWSASYHWEHAFKEGYEIKAEVSKKYGTDFRRLDKELVTLVDSLIRR